MNRKQVLKNMNRVKFSEQTELIKFTYSNKFTDRNLQRYLQRNFERNLQRNLHMKLGRIFYVLHKKKNTNSTKTILKFQKLRNLGPWGRQAFLPIGRPL